MAIKVLVFPCGSEIGLEIHSALKYSKDVQLYGASSVSDHGEFVYKQYHRITAHVEAPDFVSQINLLVDQLGIDMILPAHDSVILRLSQARAQLKAVPAAPDVEVAATCRNKNLTYRRLADFDFVPAPVSGLAETYPIFAKPAVGQGSKGAEVVHDAERHQYLLGLEEEYVFSEYLPGAEYTVDCISDRFGSLLDLAPRERMRVKSGISVRTAPVELGSEVLYIAESLARTFGFIGGWFFQVKFDRHGKLKLLEVAPRIAGSMGLSRNRGINYPLLTLYAYAGRDFQVLRHEYRIQMDRALKNCFSTALQYNTVYLDLDDTLIIRGEVNALLMALIYQWIARDISIVLLTRHVRCPRQTLSHLRIDPGLFKEIIHISDGSPKSAVIEKTDGAIFIDDSFRERLDVHRVAGIAVFDVDAIEQLFDWRA